MAPTNSITVPLEADSAQFRKEMAKATKISKKFGADVRRGANVAGKAIGAMGVASVAALGAVYDNYAKVADQSAKTADSIGMSTEALTQLQHAASITGVSNESLNNSLQKMTKNLGEVATTGTGGAAETIEALGLSTKEFFSLSPDKQFAAIAEKVKGLGTSQERAAAAAKIFGRQGIALVNTLDLGADGLAAMAEEADALGITLTRVDAAKIEAANDAMYRTGKIADAAGQQIAIGFAPIVEGLANEFLNAAKEAGGFAEITTEGVDFAVKAVGYLANVVRGISVAWTAVKAATATALDFMLRGIASLDRGITSFLNHLPGVEAQTNDFIQNFSSSMTESAASVRQELHDLAMEPLPYEGIQRWAKEVQKRSNDAAVAQARDRAGKVGQAFNPDLSGLPATPGTPAAGPAGSAIGASEEARRAAARARFGIVEEEQANSLDRQQSQYETFAEKTGGILGDAWGKSFSDIKDQFLSMLAEMAAQAAASSLASSFGGGAAGAAAGGGGGWGALASAAASAFAGAFDSGGSIPRGQFGLVGERRPEFIAGPATVIGGAQTAKIMQNAGRGGTTNITNNITGITDTRTARQAASAMGRETQRTINRTKGYN